MSPGYDRPRRWLHQAASVYGFIGFAIGRTIFWDPLRGWLAGRTDRETAVRGIAASYRDTVDLYTAGGRITPAG
jgi:5-dehydro-2-deoxygluconokinase